MIWKEKSLMFVFSVQKTIVFFPDFFFSFSFFPSGYYLNALKCSPESGPVKLRVGEILVYGTVITAYSSYCCSA